MNRKWFLVLLAGIMVLALTACTGVAEIPATPVEEVSPQGTPEDTDADANEGHNDDTDVDTEEGHDDADDDSENEAAAIDAAAIFSTSCSSCHGAEREGGGGPPLLPANLTGDVSDYVNTITNGSGPMPAWGNRLSADEINALVEYIMNEPQ